MSFNKLTQLSVRVIPTAISTRGFTVQIPSLFLSPPTNHLDLLVPFISEVPADQLPEKASSLLGGLNAPSSLMLWNP
jgi:hypothetical protein